MLVVCVNEWAIHLFSGRKSLAFSHRSLKPIVHDLIIERFFKDERSPAHNRQIKNG
jgi:hypothetical protein